MKFAKSSAVVFSALLLVSSSAFSFILADSHTHAAKGCGTFKTPEGVEGKYRVDVSMTSDHEKGEATFTERYTVGDKTKEISFRLVKANNGFFTVHAGEAKIGGGYCFNEADKKMKTCHLGAKLDNGWAERTVHIDMKNKKVYRLGSFSVDGVLTAWHDHLGCKGQATDDQQDQTQQDQAAQEN